MSVRGDTDTRIGLLLRRRREALDLSLDDAVRLANRLGLSMSASSLSRIERGVSRPLFPDVVLLCRAFGLPSEALDHELALNQEPASALGDAQEELALGLAHHFTMDFVQAEVHYKRARASAEHAGDADTWSLASCCVIDVVRRQDRTHTSERLLNEFLRSPLLNPLGRLRGRLMLVRLCSIQGRFADVRLLSQQLEPALQTAPSHIRANGLTTLGIAYLRSASYPEGYEYLVKAARSAMSDCPDHLRVRIQCPLGLALGKLGKKGAGIKMLDGALDEALNKGFLDTGNVALDCLERLNVHHPEYAKIIDTRRQERNHR